MGYSYGHGYGHTWRIYHRTGGSAPAGVAPANTVLPVISGTPTVGEILTATAGVWDGVPSPSYTYQWKRAGASISGATASTYTLVALDTATLITVTVTATNASGSASATSASFGTIRFIPANTVAPVVSGTATVGQTLSCTTGTWLGTPVPTYTYQWWRGGAPIVGATASTYTLVSADAGAMIACMVTATNTAGNSSVFSSNAVGAVNWLPANTVAPVISGTVTVGQTLSCTTGTWTGSPTPTYTYQWKRDGGSISSATASTYVLVIADVAALITCAVTATNTAGNASATSNSLGPVIAGGAEILGSETDGWATDFTYATDANRGAKIVSSAITYYALDDFYSNATTASPKFLFDVTGARVWTPHNMFVNSGTPATQSVTTVIGQSYIVTVVGSGSLVGSSGASGTASAGSPLTYTATGTTSTFTLSGSLTTIQMNRGTTALAYMTSTSARIGLCIDYDPVTHACKGLLVEPPATNLLLNSIALSTQGVTVTAVAHTLSFYGTGTVTLTGTSTAGPLTGSSATTKVSLTFTPTAGTLTLTVSGTVSFAQLETGAFATSTIPTYGAQVTRAADNVSFVLSTIPSFSTEFTLYSRWQCANTNSGRFAWSVNDNQGAPNDFAGFFAQTASGRLQVGDQTASQASVVAGALVANTTVGMAGRVKVNDFTASMNGSAVISDTVGNQPTVTHCRFGNTGGSSSASAQFYVEKMAIFPRGFTNAELVTKSAT